MNENIRKVTYICMRSAVTRQMVTGIENHHLKRILARSLFILCDAFLVNGRPAYNDLQKTKAITRLQRDDLKSKFDRLEKDYRGVYETIRDKIGAHRQPLDLRHALDHWNEIDLTSITIFQEQIEDITRQLRAYINAAFDLEPVLADVSTIVSAVNQKVPAKRAGVLFAYDTFALTRPQTGAIIPCHPDQEKASDILSAIDFLENLTETAQFTETLRTAHEVVWSLLLVDCFSVLENLYDDRGPDKGLLTRWKDGEYEGVALLEAKKASRDLGLESELRAVRNHFAAHIDQHMTLTQIHEELQKSRHTEFLHYVGEHIDTFMKACFMDIRTKMFALSKKPIHGIIAIEEKAVRDFDS